MKGYLGIVTFLLVTVYVLGEDAQVKKVADETDREGKVVKVVGFYSQTTLLSLVTVTTSSIVTCMSTSNAICAGRRRRRALIKSVNEELGDEGSLDGSSNIESGSESFVQPVESIDQRTGRRITVWSTLFSTLQLITTFPILGQTVTVSALCNQIAGSLIPQTCFVG